MPSSFAAQGGASAPDAASWIGRVPRIAVRALRSGVSGTLFLLFFVGALLPLLHDAGDVPLGFEVQPVLAQSAGFPASEVGVRIASVLTDLDDACEEAVEPRIVGSAVSRGPCPASPRSTGGLRATAAIPLDRPPRLRALG